jgi:hypothetical protein
MSSLSRPSAGVSSVTELTVVDGATFDTTTMVVDDDNNRVGINTATPTAALEIDGDVQLTPTATSTAHVKTTGSLDVRCTANLRLGTDGADSIRLGRINSTGAKIHLRSGTDTDLVVTNSKVGIGTEDPKTDLTVEGTITLKEQAAADGDTAAYGQLWVKTATPNQLYFTTDAGDDIQITSGTSLSESGDITGVTAGTGISGGGTSGAVTLNLDTHSLTEAAIADGDFIVFNDATDSNAPKREALADVATLFAGTGLTASSSVINVDASQTQITAVGTIATGTWQGTAIASAYLDADTAHLSGTQTFSGAKTFSAAAQFSNTVTVGADDQGYDVILYGDTASANVTWDTSEDDLILNGAARIVVPDGQFVLGSTAVGSTAAELNLLDGSAKSTSSITIADSDAFLIIDGTTTKQIPASDLKTYAGGGASVLDDLTDVTYSSGDLTISSLDTLTTSASAHDAAGTAVKIQAGTTTAGTTNNIAGGALTLAGGQGKGTGAGGDIIFQTANAGSSGSSLNSLATALTISDDLSSTFAGIVDITDTTQATSNDGDNGALRCEGGASIAKKLYVGSDTDIAGTLSVAQYVSHTGDTNTRLNFTPDAIYIEAGGLELAQFNEDTQDQIIFNDGGADVDFRIESDGETHMFFMEGSSNRISIGDSTDSPAATLEVTNASDGGVPLLQLNSNDADQECIDINAANTTKEVINITADALTTGAIMKLVSDSSSTGTRALIDITNDNTSATGTSLMLLKNDAAGAGGVVIETTAAETKPLLELINSTNAADKPPILALHKIGGAADDYHIGRIDFKGDDDAGTPNTKTYASILGLASDITSSGNAQSGELRINTLVNNTEVECLRVGKEDSAAGTPAFALAINQGGADLDFIVSTDNTGNILRTSAGTDQIGLASFPAANTATIYLGASFAKLLTNQTSSTLTASATHNVVTCDTSSNSVVITLPALSAALGREYTFIKTHASNNMDIKPAGSDQIYTTGSGVAAASQVRRDVFGSVLRCIGTASGWMVIADYVPT